MQEARGVAAAVASTALVGAALVANAHVTAVNVRAVAEADARVSHPHEVLETLQCALSSLQDAETGELSFIITGDPEYLAPHHVGSAAALRRVTCADRAAQPGLPRARPSDDDQVDTRQPRRRMTQLAELTRDNPAQQQRIVALRLLIEQKLGELERAVEVRERSAGGFESVGEVVVSGQGKRTMEPLRAKVAEMVALEKRLLADRAQASASVTRMTTLTNVLGLAGSLVLLLATSVVWLRRTTNAASPRGSCSAAPTCCRSRTGARIRFSRCSRTSRNPWRPSATP
jgi:CHASE3 domain sensor protein